MTKSLMDAVALAAEQPEESQEQIAAVIREELASERAWEETLLIYNGAPGHACRRGRSRRPGRPDYSA